MKQKYIIVAIVASFISLTGMALVRTIGAQEDTSGVDITVSPVFFDYAIEPGGIISDKIRVRNNTQDRLALRLDVKLLESAEDGAVSLKDAPTDSAASWVTFQTPRFTARPREWTDVPFSITVPNEAAFGYYLAISVNKDADAAQIGQPVAKVSGAAAVPILLNVRREGAKAEGKLLEFKPQNGLNQYLPVLFTSKVENTGNVHIKPRGNVFIRSNNKDIAILDINKANGNILPGGIRTFDTSWDDGFFVREPVVQDGQPKVDAKGQPETTLKIQWNKLTSMRFGKYTANLLMVYDDGTRDVAIEGTTSFWVIPYTMLAILVGSLIVLFIVGRFLVRLYIKRELKKRGA